MLDLIVRNGRIVTAAEVLPLGLEIGVRDGKIAMIGSSLPADEHTEIVDAEGAYITPGGVDSHAHIEQDNAPTGDTWETGSRSALAGGNTTVLAFATQKRGEESVWPAIAAYHAKAEGRAYCDYGFHLILTNPTDAVLEQEIPALPAAGITSIKLYMTYLPLRLDDGALFRILMAARQLGITTMIHAENHDIIEQITARLAHHKNTQTFFHAVARPQIAESEATYRAISLAEVTDAPILLVHMSAPAALRHVRDAQSRLLPIHAETCPHYLYLTSDRLRSTDSARPDHDHESDHENDHDFDGAKHICAPPLRHSQADLEQLWTALANGTYTVVSSDHAPSCFDDAQGKKKGLTVTVDEDGRRTRHVDFRVVPNGLPGIETRLPALFHRTYDPETGPPRDTSDIYLSLPRFVALTSTNPAQLYGLADRKGSLQPGLDADMVIWYPGDREVVISNDMLHHRIDYTPFEGMAVRNWPRYVFLRGRRVWDRDHGGLVGAMGDGVFLERKRSRVLAGQLGRTATGMQEGEWGAWM